MKTTALRIAIAAQLNASARSMMVAWGAVVAAADGELEIPEPIDFSAFSPAHGVLVMRIGELGRDDAFELALLEREIEWQAQPYRRTIEGLRYKHVREVLPHRYAEAQALATRINLFVETLLGDVGEPEPPASSSVMPINVVNEAGDVAQVSVEQATGVNGMPALDVLVRRIGNTFARQIQTGHGVMHGAIAARFGLNTRPGGSK